MFKIDPANKIKTELFRIVDNNQTLHFDGEPVLFAGTNHYGNRVLASLVDDDPEDKIIRYFHVIVDSETYDTFLSQAVSYREILENAGSLYVVDAKYDNSSEVVYHVNIDSIPTEYLPLENSFCPVQLIELGSVYSLSLKGQRADLNKATPWVVSSLVSKFSDFLESAINNYKPLGLVPNVELSPPAAGSYKLNFSISFSGPGGMPPLFPSPAIYREFIYEYVGFCIKALPSSKEYSDFDKFLAENQKYRNLAGRYNSLLGKGGIGKSEEIEKGLQRNLLDSIDCLRDMGENVGHNFNSMEVSNVPLKGASNLIGIIDKGFYESINKVSSDIDNLKTGDVKLDLVPCPYKIHIYHLNAESRKGNAFVYEKEKGVEEMSWPKIEILGEAQIRNTKFTESLHLNKWIEVQGIAERKKGKIKHIKIVE